MLYSGISTRMVVFVDVLEIIRSNCGEIIILLATLFFAHVNRIFCI